MGTERVRGSMKKECDRLRQKKRGRELKGSAFSDVQTGLRTAVFSLVWP